MIEKLDPKTRLLLTIGTLLLSLAAMTARADDEGGRDRHSGIAGLYWMEVDQSGFLFQVINNLEPDGTISGSSNIDGLQSLSGEHGRWERIGRHRIAFRNVFFQEDYWLIVLRGEATTNAGFTTMTGSFTCEVYADGSDPTGTPDALCPSATFSSKRM